MLAVRGADYLAQSTLHALVAALAVEALLRLWRVGAPLDRLAIRSLGLAQSLLVTPALCLLAPGRGGDEFQARFGLLALRRWDELRPFGMGAAEAAVLAAAAVGLALFLMDLLPVLPVRRDRLPPAARAPEGLERALRAAFTNGDQRGGRGAFPPALHYLDAGAPALFCAGLRRPVVVVSRGAVELLDGEELRAALGHELGHLARRDPARSWLLMAARALLCANPVAQVVARALARDAEWLADERAGGDRLALASALLKLHRAGEGAPGPARRTLPFAAALSQPLRRVRSHDVAARCRRLLEPSPPTRVPFLPLRLLLALGSLAGLSFLVA